MKKIFVIGGGSLLLLVALGFGAFFGGPMLASAHGVASTGKPTTKATQTQTKNKGEEHPLREFTRNHKDALIDQIAPQLHLTAAQLTQKLQSGERLEKIADQQGVKKEALHDVLIKSTDAVIAQELSAKHLDQQHADQLRDLVQKHPFVVAHVLHRVETKK